MRAGMWKKGVGQERLRGRSNAPRAEEMGPLLADEVDHLGLNHVLRHVGLGDLEPSVCLLDYLTPRVELLGIRHLLRLFRAVEQQVRRDAPCEVRLKT